MNSIIWMQRIDTVLLVAILFFGLIIFREDREASWPCRMLWIGLGFFCFSQATWLQGHWWPSPAGYPWASLGRDFTIAGLAALRTFTVLRVAHDERRRLQNVQRAARLNG